MSNWLFRILSSLSFCSHTRFEEDGTGEFTVTPKRTLSAIQCKTDPFADLSVDEHQVVQRQDYFR